MKIKDHQYSYSEELLKDARNTSHVQIEGDKVEASVKTKCPICQEHHDALGLTGLFDLRLKDDMLTLMTKPLHSNMGLLKEPKEIFKIKYCPFCGRKLSGLD